MMDSGSACQAATIFSTESAVKSFQRIFDLTPDGIVGKATWYKIQFIYNGIKQINSLESEGISLNEISRQFPEVLGEGSNGDFVKIIQLLLDYVSVYEETVPLIAITGYYGPETTEAVRAFIKEEKEQFGEMIARV